MQRHQNTRYCDIANLHAPSSSQITIVISQGNKSLLRTSETIPQILLNQPNSNISGELVPLISCRDPNLPITFSCFLPKRFISSHLTSSCIASTIYIFVACFHINWASHLTHTLIYSHTQAHVVTYPPTHIHLYKM